MKLIDIANKIDKSKENEDWIDITEFAREFDIDLDWVEQDRVKAFWFGKWLCTDTIVGYKMYFFDDKPIAFSFQRGRKWDEEMRWFSEDSAKQVKDYLITLITEKDEELNIDICDINEEVGDSYKIEFNSQATGTAYGRRVRLDGEEVEIIKYFRGHPLGIDSDVRIKKSNGEEIDLSIRQLDFVFYTE